MRDGIVGFGSLFCVSLVLGCGGNAAPVSNKGGATATASKGTSAQPAGGRTASKHVRVDADGKKWIGDIPYDVFFDDPLSVVSNTQTVAAKAPTPEVTTTSTTAPAAGTPSASSTGSSDWKSFIPMEQLQDETKRIRNHLTAALQSQGTFNGNYKELQADGALLSAIAGIVAQHGEEVSWKPNSRFIRDFGLELTESSKAIGKADYTKSQAAADKIQAVFDGNIPADAGDPAPTRPFGETANRWGLMKRIEKAKDWMKLEINSETKFKADLEKIQKEATLLAVFAKVVADGSYDYADEDDYKNFVQSLIESGQEAAAAAKDQAYPKFNDAINKMQKACDQCHASYGNG